jgi:hypothetical protein
LPTAVPPANALSVFVPPPQPFIGSPESSIGRFVGKYDLAARDAANRVLGRAGEEYVFHLEKQRLGEIGRGDLAVKIRWVSEQVGDGLGYDIVSFADDGSSLFIEVKTTRGPISTL